MKKRINFFAKGIAVLLILCVVTWMVASLRPAAEAKAASKTVSRMVFLKGVVDAMTGLECLDGHKLTFSVGTDGSVTAGEMTKKTFSAAEVKKLAKKFSVTEENARYIAAAIGYGIINGSTFKSVKSKITRAAAGIILAKADRTIRSADRKYTSEDISLGMSRIVDIKKIKKSADRKLFAEAYMDGFFIGKKTGDYEDTRKLSPTAKIKSTEAKKMYKMVKSLSARYELSPFYQVLRTSKKNLPKNADKYAYILDSYPNTYYETGWHMMEYGDDSWFDMKSDGKTPDGIGAGTLEQRLNRQLGPLMVYPAEMDEFFKLDVSQTGKFQIRNGLRTWENVQLTVESSIEFYELALNVNYKTIKNDKEWQNKMLKFMKQKDIDVYIENCIKNKTIIECDKVAADLSGAYFADGHSYVKIYAHVKVVSDAHIEDKTHWKDELYGNLYPVIGGYGTGFSTRQTREEFFAANYKKGQWFDFFTVTEGCDSNVDTGFKYNLAGTHYVDPITVDWTGLYPWLLSPDYVN